MSGGGGGIIIRNAIRTALTDPIVYGSLPANHKAAIDPFIHDEAGTWSPANFHKAHEAFNWAAKHCQ